MCSFLVQEGVLFMQKEVILTRDHHNNKTFNTKTQIRQRVVLRLDMKTFIDLFELNF